MTNSMTINYGHNVVPPDSIRETFCQNHRKYFADIIENRVGLDNWFQSVKFGLVGGYNFVPKSTLAQQPTSEISTISHTFSMFGPHI